MGGQTRLIWSEKRGRLASSCSCPSVGGGFALELKIAGEDGIPLHARLWKAASPRGALVIAHGLGEHSGNYQELAEQLVGAPSCLDVLAYDFRGHGLSPGRRGFVPDYDLFVQDLRRVLAWEATECRGKPLFLMGHSNGAVVAVQAMLRDSRPVSGLILSSPSLAVSARAPRWKLLVGHLLEHLAPQVTLPVGLDSSQMTRDSAQLEAHRADTLRHDRISAPLYFGMLKTARNDCERAGSLTVPTLVVLGEDDQIVDQTSVRSFVDRLGTADRTLICYSGMRHEPFNELGREAVYRDLGDWFSRRLDTGGNGWR